MLLFAAAFVWSFAGLMLLARGFFLSADIKTSFWIRIISGISGGSLFYLLLFSRISSGHINRIISLKNDEHCLFSFFSIRSYLLMALMISTGIILRKSEVIASGYLGVAYIAMGIPLLISSISFFYSGLNYKLPS